MFAVLWCWSHLSLQDNQTCHHTLYPLVCTQLSLGIPTRQGNSLESHYLKVTKNKYINTVASIKMDHFTEYFNSPKHVIKARLIACLT